MEVAHLECIFATSAHEMAKIFPLSVLYHFSFPWAVSKAVFG